MRSPEERRTIRTRQGITSSEIDWSDIINLIWFILLIAMLTMLAVAPVIVIKAWQGV